MRLYQELWYLIRDENGNTISISCPLHLRRRIRKAVYKEKDRDSTYDKRRRLETSFTPTGVTFRLRGTNFGSGVELIPSTAYVKSTKVIAYESLISKATKDTRESSGDNTGSDATSPTNTGSF